MTGRPRIVIEANAHHLLNLGDVAMLQIAVERFAGLWPTATMHVITQSPDRLGRYCPAALPLDAEGRRAWFLGRPLTHALDRVSPFAVSSRLSQVEGVLGRKSPHSREWLLRSSIRLRGQSTRPLRDFLAALADADLVVSTGAGAFNDHFAPLAINILDLLDLAKRRHGAITALLGHGIGPFGDPSFQRRAREVLPTVDLITLRESVFGEPLLVKLGVNPERVITTGDDAVELAYRADRPTVPGTSIGFGLRLARYSHVDARSARAAAGAVIEAARRYATEPLPISISHHPSERDDAVAARLLGRPFESPTPESSFEVVERIQQCRVVVTGSYHAAVFALAQGIAAIGLTQSPYYDAKFLGLKDQFEGLLPIVPLGQGDVSSRLAYEIDEAWRTADEVGPRLRRLATQQVRRGHAAYQRLYELVTGAIGP